MPIPDENGNPYFDTAFAVDGNLTPVPDGIQPTGSVSYTQGWGPYYSQDPTVDPATALLIDRAQTNQMFNSITQALQAYQQFGTPAFITTAMNGGSPFSYGQYARVEHGGVVYQSLVASNTDTPPSSKWAIVSVVNSGIPQDNQTGTNYDPVASDIGKIITRSNAGTNMTDTLAGSSSPLAAGWFAYLQNNDTLAFLNYDVASGGSISVGNNPAADAFTILPGQMWLAISYGSGNYVATPLGSVKQTLLMSTTFYVSTAGSDSTGNGSSGQPWGTVQHALNYLANNINLNGFTATIQLADGTYASFTQTLPITGAAAGSVIINGNSGTPSNVVISASTGNAAAATGAGCGFTLQNMKIANSGGNGINCGSGAIINLGAGMVYGACTASQINAQNGGNVSINGSYTINGNAGNHIEAAENSSIVWASTVAVTVSGTPAFGGAFAVAAQCGVLYVNPGLSFTGAATGTRYTATTNGVIQTQGSGATFFPGNAGGSTTTGGQYV